MQEELKTIAKQNVWLLVLLALAGGFVLYVRNVPREEERPSTPELSSDSFRILDSTVTPQIADQIIIIEPIQ
jgi:hypothetical protein